MGPKHLFVIVVIIEFYANLIKKALLFDQFSIFICALLCLLQSLWCAQSFFEVHF